MLRYFVLATAIGAGALLTSGRASAHAMSAKLDTTTETFKLEAYFEEDLPAEFADVTVTDAEGNIVLTGKTDERGVWTFPRPKPGTYTLRVRQTGHVAKLDFAVGGAEEAPAPPRRPNKWVGLAIGVVGLLGVSGVSWFRRRRGRRLE